jgi:hypothetical protein
MSFDIVMKGAHFTSLAPAIIPYNEYGYPIPALHSLYLFENGNVGDSLPPILDSSGNGNSGSYIPASNAVRIAAGVKTGDTANRGHGIIQPLDISQDFTIFDCVRYVSGAPATRYPLWWAPSPIMDLTTMANAQITTSVGNSRGRLGIMGLRSDGFDYAGIRLSDARSNPTPSVGLGGGPVEFLAGDASKAKDSWIVYALSINHATGKIRLRTLGQSFEISATKHDIAGLVGKARGISTYTAQPAADTTITPNGVPFTFKGSGAAGNQANIGASLSETLANMVAALNASVIPAVALAAYEATATEIRISYKTGGTGGNAFTLAAGAGSNGTASAATLTQGATAQSVFAATIWAVTETVVSQRGICGAYLGALSDAEKDVVLAATRARMALRGAMALCEAVVQTTAGRTEVANHQFGRARSKGDIYRPAQPPPAEPWL